MRSINISKTLNLAKGRIEIRYNGIVTNDHIDLEKIEKLLDDFITNHSHNHMIENVAIVRTILKDCEEKQLVIFYQDEKGSELVKYDHLNLLLYEKSKREENSDCNDRYKIKYEPTGSIKLDYDNHKIHVTDYPGIELITEEIEILGQLVPITTNILFQDKTLKEATFGIEICEDLWTVNPPSNNHALAGATMIFNLSSSNELIGKQEYRKSLVSSQSARTISAYIYASSGVMESTSDILFGGARMIYENGSILAENKRFELESNIITADIDVLKLANDRIKNKSFMKNTNLEEYKIIKLDIKDNIKELNREYKEYPFVPSNELERNKRCEEIIEIQSTALARRLIQVGNPKCVIGMSGGLDSTLAFLVIVKAYEKLKRNPKDIIGITMPGFGTTDRTYQNSIDLVKEYGGTLKEISIKDAALLHMKDIGLPETDRSITYENIQARERTQILMDVANMENGLVIGTGDLSELALGWCTYNGDHMSMYAVNTSIPKTLVRYLVAWVKDTTDGKKKEVLQDILDTPISPELLPPDEAGNILQKTESSIGPYVLHDFYLYHFLRYGATPKKIYTLAKHTFKNSFSKEEIKKWLKVFIRRFFTQQFKRNCIPDGVKVGSISLSPRGDLRMPSDANYETWIKELEDIND